MKVKIGEKVFRLKYVESDEIGDSLMELVIDDRSNHKFKAGDIVYEDGRIMIVKKYPNEYYCLVYPKLDSNVVLDGIFGNLYGLNFDFDGFRYATEEEKNTLFELLNKEGKRWNAEKLCVEDVHERKFKAGDKVRIKDGISSQTHHNIYPYFDDYYDKFLGKTLTVSGYTFGKFVTVDESICTFSEDWFEPANYLEIGDWVVAWNTEGDAVLGKLEKTLNVDILYFVDGKVYQNAVKWDGTKEQLEKISTP